MRRFSQRGQSEMATRPRMKFDQKSPPRSTWKPTGVAGPVPEGSGTQRTVLFPAGHGGVVREVIDNNKHGGGHLGTSLLE